MDSFLDRILAAAARHGQYGEPDMEVGDLQQLARDLWAALTPDQQRTFAGRVIDWNEFINDWLPEEEGSGKSNLRS